MILAGVLVPLLLLCCCHCYRQCLNDPILRHHCSGFPSRRTAGQALPYNHVVVLVLVVGVGVFVVTAVAVVVVVVIVLALVLLCAACVAAAVVTVILVAANSQMIVLLPRFVCGALVRQKTP